MTTKQGSPHLHPLEMKKAFVSTCRHMFPRDAPLLELTRRREFTPGFAALTFANRNVLEEGMGMLLFEVMDAESEGEEAARRVIQAHARLDPITVATSLVNILLNTRSEVPFFAAIVASDKITGEDREKAKKDGRMRASVEFLKACAEEGVGYNEIIIGATLVSLRNDIVEAAAAMGRGTGFDYEGVSLFRGVLAISGRVFEDEGLCAPLGATRGALLHDYVDACVRLHGRCINSLHYFSEYFASALADEDRLNWREGRALIRLFTDEDALRRIGDAKDDPRGLQLVIEGILGLREAADLQATVPS